MVIIGPFKELPLDRQVCLDQSVLVIWYSEVDVSYGCTK